MAQERMSHILTAGLLFAVTASTAAAQGRLQRQPTPNDTLKSPEVLPDNRVAFRIYAPKASEVSVSGDWIAQGRGTGAKLEKDEQGVWSLTVGPLVPDFYSYSFTVDGGIDSDGESVAYRVGMINAGEDAAAQNIAMSATTSDIETHDVILGADVVRIVCANARLSQP